MFLRVCVVWLVYVMLFLLCFRGVFFQAEDGIRDLVRSRGLGDVYKRQPISRECAAATLWISQLRGNSALRFRRRGHRDSRGACLLYTSDAADERSSVDLGGRRIIKKKKIKNKKIVFPVTEVIIDRI